MAAAVKLSVAVAARANRIILSSLPKKRLPHAKRRRAHRHGPAADVEEGVEAAISLNVSSENFPSTIEYAQGSGTGCSRRPYRPGDVPLNWNFAKHTRTGRCHDAQFALRDLGACVDGSGCR